MFGFSVATTLVAMRDKGKDPDPEEREKNELNIDSSAFEPGTLLFGSVTCFSFTDELYSAFFAQLNCDQSMGFDW
jgi:hypothetical protein